ncbi:uncharacterized protein MELLADRAFT_51777 [Melampsora larici-populina 98AG31]|uniref:Uncharacterized protein n=1 Tax=Melampsora larici-populina (strain 98AG31 / pathotype 3-4-7) TaxID=747676 RepID=F4RAZ6_MELLP|nr:uncharacterized protein MELLADRAFT_51777 [Melampsora larici-populina 98AG31]EGG10691.1 hypothetical protein MELLADRAFT_51777 [Melampsora larici-populina 98AG31]
MTITESRAIQANRRAQGLKNQSSSNNNDKPITSSLDGENLPPDAEKDVGDNSDSARGSDNPTGRETDLNPNNSNKNNQDQEYEELNNNNPNQAQQIQIESGDEDQNRIESEGDLKSESKDKSLSGDFQDSSSSSSSSEDSDSEHSYDSNKDNTSSSTDSISSGSPSHSDSSDSSEESSSSSEEEGRRQKKNKKNKLRKSRNTRSISQNLNQKRLQKGKRKLEVEEEEKQIKIEIGSVPTGDLVALQPFWGDQMTDLHSSIPLTVLDQTFARAYREEYSKNHHSSSSKNKSNKGLDALSEYKLTFGEWSECMSLFRRHLAGYYAQKLSAKQLKLHIENVKAIKHMIFYSGKTPMKDIGILMTKYENQAKDKYLQAGKQMEVTQTHAQRADKWNSGTQKLVYISKN